MGMDVYGNNPSSPEGEYFRASIWSWRPIHSLCETVLKRELPWSHNDGEGFQTQEECDELAKKLERYLVQYPKEDISLESEIRVDDRGVFLGSGATGGRSAYYTTREHVREFIKFLRCCGGFEIC